MSQLTIEMATGVLFGNLWNRYDVDCLKNRWDSSLNALRPMGLILNGSEPNDASKLVVVEEGMQSLWRG
jgi:hypothetical protein